MDRRAAWIASRVGGRLVGEDRDVRGPAVIDSREARPGCLFVALRGSHTDGHAFVGDAAARGARVALVQHEVADAGLAQVVVPDCTRALGDLARAHLADLRAAGEPRVVAITGSVGKTTTKDLLAQVLAETAPTVAPPRSYNNEVGCPLTVCRATPATRFLVLEMGASGIGHIAYLSRIAPPDVAVELLVGSAHLGPFGSRDAIARAKTELVEGLVPGGVAVLNADDPRVAAMAGHAPGRVVRFSTRADSGADVLALHVRTDALERPSFDLAHAGRVAGVHLRLSGAQHVHNALAAAGAALALGIGLERVAGALSRATARSPHRMDVRRARVGAAPVLLVDDSYNANPDSMRAALRTLRRIARGRRTVAVLGEMLELGPRSAELHREVGREAAQAGLDVVVGVGSGAHPIVQALAGHAEVRECLDADTARSLLSEVVRPGDVVLVKGSNGSGVWKMAESLERGDGAGDAR